MKEFNYKDFVTLKEHLSQRLEDLEEKINLRFEATAIASDKADVKMEARLAGINGLLGSMSDITAKFITRNEVDLKLDAINKSRKDSTALIISMISLLLGLAGVVSSLFAK